MAQKSKKKKKEKKELLLKISSSKEITTKLSKYTVYEISNEDLEFNISRRYNDFKWMRNLLRICYPGLFVPPLPPPVFLGRFADSFVSKRRAELETFLLRVCRVESFTRSEAYECFMHCNDTDFSNQRSEIDSNQTMTNPATVNLSLQKIYPKLKDLTIDSEKSKFIQLKKRLQSIHEQMKVIDILGAKLHNHFNKISHDIPLYLNALKSLHSNEVKSELFKNGNLPKYTLFFMAFEKYTNKIKQIFDTVFFSNLSYQHKDIIAYMEIFQHYESNKKFYDRLCKAVEKWEEMEEKNKEKKIEFKANQIKQKEADCNSKNDVFSLLSMTRKIVLTKSIVTLTKYKAKCWRDKINAFYTLQMGLNQLTKESNIEQNNDDVKDEDDFKKIQLIKDENKTLHLQNKTLRKQIKLLTKDADGLRNENIHLSAHSAKQLQNIAIIKKEQNKNNNLLRNHQFDAFPSLSQLVEKYEHLKNEYLTKPPKCIVRDVEKYFVNHSAQFVTKMIHEIMFDILFVSFNKMKEYEIDWLLRAGKLFYIQNVDILRDLCRPQLQCTFMHIFDEIKDNQSKDILDIILSSYSYKFSSESKANLLKFIDDTLCVCWQLVLSQNGDLLIKPKTFDFEPRSKQILYNSDIYDAFFGSNLKESLNYIIWPAIYDKANNEPMSKIYALFQTNVPKFNQQFIQKKVEQVQYDTIRIVAEPEGVSSTTSNECNIIKSILSKQESGAYKVFVGIHFGEREVSVGYVDNHNKKKFNSIFKKYPSVLLNVDNELEGIGSTAFDDKKEADCYAFDNFMLSICENKLIQIENKYEQNSNQQAQIIDLEDKNGKGVNVSVLFDVTLHYFWNSTLDVIKKEYLSKYNEHINEDEIEWKVSIIDMVYTYCKPLLLSSGQKLGLLDNIKVIKESQAIATNYCTKLMDKSSVKSNIKFMSIVLNKYSLMIGCYKVMNEYKIKELVQPKSIKNVNLSKITDRFVTLLIDIFGKEEFDKLTQNKISKIDEIKLNFLSMMQSDYGDDLFDHMFDIILDPMFKEIDKMLAIKSIESCKQHIIICGELSEIECIQHKIRNDKKSKIEAANIHFAKSKIAKGTALYEVASPKHNNLTYRANKSWGISIQREYDKERDDKNRKVFIQKDESWIVSGAFYEIIKKGQMVQANHCEVIWVQPIHKKKIQIDVYSSESYIDSKDNALYIDECEYEGSQSFELLSEWKNKKAIPIVFWCDVEENNKIRLHVSLNDLNDATSRVIDLRWSVKSK